jgi:hypothetical protein
MEVRMVNQGKLIASLWVFGAAVYLMISFTFENWHVSWLVFPIVGIFSIFLMFYLSRKSNKELSLAHFLRNRAFSLPLIWMTAVSIYLFLGFSFNLWHPGWIIFVFAAMPTILI